MGIGRREFVRQFTGALATLASSAGPAAAVLEHLYINRRHGLAFTKPSDWSFVSVAAVGEVQAGTVFDVPVDEDWLRELYQADGSLLPIVVVADERNAFDIPSTQPEGIRMAPSSALYYEGTFAERDIRADVSAPLMDYVEEDLEYFELLLEDFTLVDQPVPRRLSDCQAAEYTSEYLYRHQETTLSVPMRERTIYFLQDYFLQDSAIYSLRMCDFPQWTPPIEHDFDSFVETVRVV